MNRKLQYVLIGLAVLLAIFSLAQYLDVGGEGIDLVLVTKIIISFSIVVLFIWGVRVVMLWYWKVDVLVQSNEETNRLLRAILNELKKDVKV